jgi:hypothetical protein
MEKNESLWSGLHDPHGSYHVKMNGMKQTYYICIATDQPYFRENRMQAKLTQDLEVLRNSLTR